MADHVNNQTRKELWLGSSIEIPRELLLGNLLDDSTIN